MKKLLALLVSVVLLVLCAAPGFAADPFSGMLTYEESQYRVGYDMVPGEYVLLATTDFSGYFCVSSDALGNKIICNELFDVNSIVTVRTGEYIELSRCIAILATDFYTRYTIRTDNPGVMLKVGYDIMPGTYRVTAVSGENGYYCIYNDSRHDDIIDNDLFRGSCYITLRAGQYVILSRCYISK